MNNNEFLQEMIEYDKERYHMFEKYQNITVEIFKAFHEICVRNNITYYLAYGSLLGAYRDKGYIPWDCDFDVSVPYDQIEKLHECLSKELGKEYYFVSDRTDATYPYFQLRVCKTGYNHGVHLDVFYMFGLPNDDTLQKQIMKKINRIFYLRKIKCESENVKIKSTRSLIKKLTGSILSLDRLKKQLNNICELYPLETSNYLSLVFHEDIVFPSALILHPSKIECAGLAALAPHNIEGYLAHYYGDWKKYFPIENRYSEFEFLYGYLKNIELEHERMKNK